MMNYKLLLVDDEELIRVGLKNRLLFLNFPNVEIVESSSGAEALQLMQSDDIALALVDICMPDMTGLEMIAEAKRLGIRTQFLLLSGFSEFKYAQTAIHLGVRAYLNKPVSNQELKTHVEAVLTQLQAEQEKTDESAKQRNCEREFDMLLSGINRTAEPRRAYPGLTARYPELFDGKSTLYVSLLHIGKADHSDAPLSIEQLDSLRNTIRSILLQTDRQCSVYTACNYQNPQRIWIVFRDATSHQLKGKVEQTFLTLRQGLERKANVYITMGVSSLSNTLAYECAAEARTSLQQRKLYGRSNIYFYEALAAYETQSFPEADLELLRTHMARRDRAGILRQLKVMFDENALLARNEEYFHVLWVRIIGLMLSTFDGIDTALTHRLLRQLVQWDSMGSQSKIINSLTELMDACLKSDTTDSDARSKIRHALEYIDERFAEEIIINDLAARFGLSHSHFTATFKKMVGMSTLQYITNVRIQKAKQLLENSDENINSIAKKVGYKDSLYFFRIFKKMTGVTPQVYRQQARTGKS